MSDDPVLHEQTGDLDFDSSGLMFRFFCETQPGVIAGSLEFDLDESVPEDQASLIFDQFLVRVRTDAFPDQEIALRSPSQRGLGSRRRVFELGGLSVPCEAALSVSVDIDGEEGRPKGRYPLTLRILRDTATAHPVQQADEWFSRFLYGRRLEAGSRRGISYRQYWHRRPVAWPETRFFGAPPGGSRLSNVEDDGLLFVGSVLLLYAVDLRLPAGLSATRAREIFDGLEVRYGSMIVNGPESQVADVQDVLPNLRRVFLCESQDGLVTSVPPALIMSPGTPFSFTVRPSSATRPEETLRPFQEPLEICLHTLADKPF